MPPSYPILEFDPSPEAVIEPRRVAPSADLRQRLFWLAAEAVLGV